MNQAQPTGNLLQVRDLKKHFPVQRGTLRRVVGQVKAVDGVSFYIVEGETLGLVGESGSGKTTVGRCINRLYRPTAGTIEMCIDGKMHNMTLAEKDELKEMRRNIQMIFQDPYSSLNPRLTIGDIIQEPLVIHGIGSREGRRQRAEELLEKVGLDRGQMNRFPHQFSGGQRQRIGVARALSIRPRLVICDEPVSALDVSIQAQVLNLLADLQKEFNLTLLFIAHDMSVVEYISNRVMVMYLGKIAEVAPSDIIFQRPRHPYTEALLSAIPKPGIGTSKDRILLPGDIPDPANPPPGCAFHTRCLYAQEICSAKEPALLPLPENPDAFVACHRYEEFTLRGFE
ncbi:MAG: ABC transporter ATP-binding protein [Anaerolineae bacterium]